MQKKLFTLFLVTSLLLSQAPLIAVQAAGPDADGDGVDDTTDKCSGTPASTTVDATGCSAAQTAAKTATTTPTTPTVTTGQTTLQPPYGTYATDPKYVVAAVLQALLGIVGAATLLMFIWGGFRLIFSEGNEEKITKSRAILVWATIGLAVVMASYSILNYTFNLIQKAATGAI